jgi:hypothetical protein
MNSSNKNKKDQVMHRDEIEYELSCLRHEVKMLSDLLKAKANNFASVAVVDGVITIKL